MEIKIFRINERDYEFKIHIEKRNSVRASVTNKGVNIRIPKHLSSARKKEELNNFISWAIKKIENSPPIIPENKRYIHLDQLKIFEKTYLIDVEIRNSKKNFAKINGNTIYFKIAEKNNGNKRQEYIRKQLQKLLAKHHIQELFLLTHELNRKHFQKNLGEITFKYTKSRWGCCNPRTKEINISTRLLLAPADVLEYVIIHELAHLIEPNHSRNFWKLVYMADPRYKDKIKWLNEHGHKLVI
jgi:hypothetical protein